MKLGTLALQRLSGGSVCLMRDHPLALPAFARDLAPGVVHLGLGAFHRAHQALVFDALLQAGDARWGVLGVAMRNTSLADSLKAQDGLYSVKIADAAGVRWQIGGAVLATAVAAREPGLVVQAIAAPATRWLTLTVTEKGYGTELARLIVGGLAARRAAGVAGLTIASCDNLQHNGRKLQALCLQEASDDPGLQAWIETSCAFPNSMVDRIVPAATPETLRNAEAALGLEDAAALATEGFWEWVIEDCFADAGDAGVLAGAGLRVVPDVSPYEDAKLRMLNGSHSAIACIGAVAGLQTVSECIDRAPMRRFVHDMMTLDVAPFLKRPDVANYRDALLLRFANPALQHRVHQICSDTSQKIPQRWVPSVQDGLKAGRLPQHLAFAAAAWMRYLQAVDDHGRSYALNDPMAEALHALAMRHAADAPAAVQALSALTPVWGSQLPADEGWRAAVAHWLALIRQKGVLPALEQLHSRPFTLAQPS